MYPKIIQELINYFSHFPNIGPKTAERFVFYLLKKSPEDLNKIAETIKKLQEIKFCQICGNLSEQATCSICSDPKRDRNIICVVAEIQDLMVLEKIKEYKGLYHVLGGTINQFKQITPEKLNIKNLLKRLENQKIREVILALNPDLEGETTALYLIDKIRPFRVKISRLARGLPTGSDLTYADEITLINAIKRRENI
jgi:recombination protein RecR